MAPGGSALLRCTPQCIIQVARDIGSVRPDLVGVSIYCTSIRNSLRLISEAKNCGAATLLGNDHAAFHWRQLLSQCPDLDFVCTSDVGEDTIVALVESLLGNREKGSVPGLAFRDDSGNPVESEELVRTEFGGSSRSTELDRIPLPNRALLPQRYWAHYANAFRQQYHLSVDAQAVTGVATINGARGCARAKDPCRYCGIADLVPRGSSGKRYWDDVRAARQQVGANFLYEAFDSATSWPTLIERWLEARPDDLRDVRFKMYAQAAETSPRTVELFSDFGVYCVNSGFDSGHDATLKLLKGQKDSVDTNRRAATLWTDAGIEVYTSFVLVGLGSEAKTRESLDSTLKFAEWLTKNTLTVSLDSALLYPDKSSIVGRWIWRPDLAESEAPKLGWGFIDFELLRKVSARWAGEIYLDCLDLCADFARVCRVQPELLMEYEREIERIALTSNLNFGRSQGGPTNY